MGDAIMAVFYNDKQDSAKKAVQAAFAMKKELSNFNKNRLTQGKEEIVIGIGINTGIVIEGNVGTKERLEHTVLGDTVNLASRLEDLTKNSKHLGIMISNSTYERVKEFIRGGFF